MAGALIQTISVPTSFTTQANGRFQGSARCKQSVIMMASLQSHGLRLRNYSSLRPCNTLNFLRFLKRDFHSRAAISVRKKKGRNGVVKAMFERFTEKAIEVIMLAQEEARRLGHNFVGTEQILLGLISEGTGIAAKVLKSMGINLKDARVEVEKIIGRGSGFVAVEIPFTPRAKRVLELSLEEARQLGHNYNGSEHLLLALLREGEGVAARVIENLGADPSNIRTQVIRMVGENTEAVGAGVGGSSASNKMPTLEEYGTNLTKLAEEAHLVATHEDMMDVITDEPLQIMKINTDPTTSGTTPQVPKPKSEWTSEDKKHHNLDNVEKDIILKTLDSKMFLRIKTCVTAKQILDKLILICEGTEDIKENKLSVAIQKFEEFKMKSGESVDKMESKFTAIHNELTMLNKVYTNKKMCMKILRALPSE
ncbi:ATP-dependent Clp protease ATP-binding subunit ClpA cd4b, chloroplastic [Dionaea muscipula]